MNIKKLADKAATQYAAVGALLTLPVLSMAADGDISADAVTQISALKTGVVAVGGAILAIALASVGFFVIRRLVNRA